MRLFELCLEAVILLEKGSQLHVIVGFEVLSSRPEQGTSLNMRTVLGQSLNHSSISLAEAGRMLLMLKWQGGLLMVSETVYGWGEVEAARERAVYGWSEVDCC